MVSEKLNPFSNWNLREVSPMRLHGVDDMGCNEHWGPTAGHDKYVMISQSSVKRSMLKADDLSNSIKTNRQTKNPDLLWIQESSSQTVLFNCQRNGRPACLLGKLHAYYLLQPGSWQESNSRPLRVIFPVKQHYESGLWPLELNSGSDPGSAIYCLCSKGKIFHLFEPLFPHL